MSNRLPRLIPVVLALVASATLAASLGRAGTGSCTPDSGWGTPKPGLADEVFSLVNQHRASLGLVELSSSGVLGDAAVWKARHMAAYGYMAHDDPAPPIARTAAERIAACGYSGGGWGENIAYGYPTAAAVMAGWLGSPGHKANIENPSFRSLGVGAAAGDGTIYWAQDFGTAGGSASPPPQPPPADPQPPTPPSPPGPEPAESSPPTSPAPPPPPPSAAKSWEGGIVVASMKMARPRPGGRFSVRVALASRLTGVKVSCRASVRGRRLRVTRNVYRGGEAVCSWQVPRRTSGAILRGSMGVRADGRRSRVTFARKVS